ncbi:DUF423 domain-containing protein [Terasakiella pusilla]|uniref:DUF423 domain-containing protein n=1 Tax=Terasakiella pusilla TaxID=64973 RepID=UPI003AA7E355
MRLSLILAGLFGASAVAIGAVSAHADLSEYGRTLVDKGVLYQFIHTLAIVATAAFGVEKSKLLLVAQALFTLGILLFCGSLYSLGFTETRLFGNSAPLGGTSFILGWLFVAAYGFMYARSRPAQP